MYRARDTKLSRHVALKVLPEAFALDEGRVARFKREAQVLASLNHPNIAAIYGFEDSGSIRRSSWSSSKDRRSRTASRADLKVRLYDRRVSPFIAIVEAGLQARPSRLRRRCRSRARLPRRSRSRTNMASSIVI